MKASRSSEPSAAPMATGEAHPAGTSTTTSSNNVDRSVTTITATYVPYSEIANKAIQKAQDLNTGNIIGAIKTAVTGGGSRAVKRYGAKILCKAVLVEVGGIIAIFELCKTVYDYGESCYELDLYNRAINNKTGVVYYTVTITGGRGDGTSSTMGEWTTYPYIR